MKKVKTGKNKMTLKVTFKNNGEVDEKDVKYVVIQAKYNDKWIFVRHKERNTWEIPGGKKEENESIEAAAKRELYEETGAAEFDLFPICIYNVNRGDGDSYGQLFYSNVENIGMLPECEIKELKLLDSLPSDLTYPLIQPYLYKKVNEYLILKETKEINKTNEKNK